MTFFKRSLHIAGRHLFYFVSVGIMLFLLAIVGALWISDAITERKDELAQWASEQIGYPVEVADAGLYWLDWFPKLYLHELRILHPETRRQLISLDQLYIGLDLLDSLQQREPVVDSLSMGGLTLAVQRQQDGQLSVPGIERELTEADLDWHDWLHMLRRIELNSIVIDYNDALQPQLNGRYQLHQGQLKQQDAAWQLAVEVSPPVTLGSRLRMQAEFSLDTDQQLSDWQGHVTIDYLQLAPFSEFLQLEQLWLEQGHISSLDLQLAYSDQQFQGQASIIANQLQLSSKREGVLYEPVSLERLAGDFSWQLAEQQWQVDGRNVLLAVAGAYWPQTDFSLRQTADGWRQMHSDYLRLSDLTAVALLLDEMPEWLEQQQPAGHVHDLQVRYHPEQGLDSAKARLANVAVLPWQDWPGVTGLSLELDWQHQQLAIHLDSTQLAVYAESWLAEAVYFEALSGDVQWQQQTHGWQLQSEALRLWNDDLQIRVDGSLQQSNATLSSDLQIQLQEVVASRWLSYIPERVLDSDFFEWAEPAFVDGLIRDGSVTLRGDLAEFPFTAPDSGLFALDLQVENAELQFAHGWPNLERVSGRVHGEGNALQVSSQSGQIAGLEFVGVEVLIENFISGSSQLTVEGDIQGSTQQALQFLNNSPLQSRFGPIADALSASGNSLLWLRLQVPLADAYETRVQGRLDLNGSHLRLADWPELTIDGVQGTVQFDNDGVASDTLQAQVLGGAASINVLPESGQTVITATGKLTSSALQTAWPEFIPSFMHGALAYQTRVSISEPALGDFFVAVEVDSDLTGIQLDMPAPFGKSAEQKRAFRFASLQNEQGMSFSSRYGDVLDANWRFVGDAVYGRVAIGGQASTAQTRDFVIQGQLDEVDVEQWRNWYQTLPEMQSTTSALYPDLVDLQIAKVILDQQQLDQLQLQLRRDAAAWRAQLRAAQAQGEIIVPDDLSQGAAIVMNLEHLQLHWPEPAVSEAVPPGLSSVQPLWPSLAIRVADFRLDDMRLGRLDLDARQVANSWRLNHLNLSSAVYDLRAEGLWQQLSDGDISRMSFTVNSSDLKGLLASLGYQQAIEANRANMEIELSWPGAPIDFSQATMQGSLALDVGSGRLLDVEPGAAGRIFGLLSFAALPRRLLLDFSDFFGKGMGFAGINGSFQFSQGVATTDNLIMRGDSASIAVKGPVNLIERSYNQKVRVTPSVSSTLPLAGAVAGGPVGLAAGTAIFLADRLAGRLFDRDIVDVISYSYDLTGPWDDPQLKIARPAQD